MGDHSPRPWLRSARRLWARAVHLWHVVLAEDDPPARSPRVVGPHPASPNPPAANPAVESPPAANPAADSPESGSPGTPPPPGRDVPTPATTAGPPPADRTATVHLGLLMGPRATEIALLRAEIQRRERDVELLRAAMAEVLGRFAELAHEARQTPAPPADPQPEAPPAPSAPPPPSAPPAPSATPPPFFAPSLATTPRLDPPSATPSAAPPPPLPDRAAADPVAPPPDGSEDAVQIGSSPEQLAAASEIARGTEVVARSAPGRQPLLSVVVVTSSWPASLLAAVDSVTSQDYDAWELLVVDDVRPVRPAPHVSADARVRVLTGPGRGPAPAHDRALASLRGELVTFLADDGLMAPGWLRALAWAQREWPGTEAFVGSTLIVADAPEARSAPALVGLVGEGRARLVSSPGSGSLAHRPDTAGARLGEGDRDPALALLVNRARPVPVVATITVRRTAAAANDPGRDAGGVERHLTGVPAGPVPRPAGGRRPVTGGLPPLGGNGMLRAVDVSAARH